MMAINLGSLGAYSSRPSRKKKVLFGSLGFLLFITVAFYGVYSFRDRIFFQFENDQHGKILRRLADCTDLIHRKAKGQESLSQIAQDKSILDFIALLDSMKDNEKLSGIVYFARGKILFELFSIVPARNPSLYYDIFFLDFVDRYAMPTELDRPTWQQAILSLRKAMVLNLPDLQKKEAAVNLAELYIWGGKPFWAFAYELLEQYHPLKDDIIHHLFNITLAQITPDFNKLSAVFGEEPVTLWQAIYYLRAGNAPLGYSLLYKLAESDNMVHIKHNALYLLGKIHGKEKRYRQQIYYYRKIDAAEFLPRAPWFLEEFVYLLRFVGEVSEAQRFIAQYEKIVSGQQSQ